MNGRRRAGLILMVGGLGIVLIGGAGAALNLGAPATATNSPAASSTATAPTTAPVTHAPVTSTPATITVPPATVAPTSDTLALARGFFAELQNAIRAGKQSTMAASLDQAVIERYGHPECETTLSARSARPSEAFEILAVQGPAPWDWVTDGKTTTVPDTITVDARVTGPDPSGNVTTETRELHVRIVGGHVRWFTDCGTPLS